MFMEDIINANEIIKMRNNRFLQFDMDTMEDVFYDYSQNYHMYSDSYDEEFYFIPVHDFGFKRVFLKVNLRRQAKNAHLFDKKIIKRHIPLYKYEARFAKDIPISPENIRFYTKDLCSVEGFFDILKVYSMIEVYHYLENNLLRNDIQFDSGIVNALPTKEDAEDYGKFLDNHEVIFSSMEDSTAFMKSTTYLVTHNGSVIPYASNYAVQDVRPRMTDDIAGIFIPINHTSLYQYLTIEEYKLYAKIWTIHVSELFMKDPSVPYKANNINEYSMFTQGFGQLAIFGIALAINIKFNMMLKSNINGIYFGLNLSKEDEFTTQNKCNIILSLKDLGLDPSYKISKKNAEDIWILGMILKIVDMELKSNTLKGDSN